MKKKLTLILESCSDCPYKQYDDEFSGFVCTKENNNIDLIITGYNLERTGWPAIPEECCLETIPDNRALKK
ncbi:MAG: hypothetical protein A3K77_00745 [Euryarchaeota archaeon RBG_13_31_8]|nr:MAG: hypothetical protein A3K77_00745 [Euryarchaeota archaeon RBG_13_31_8]